jgi:glucose-6-phosphate isomerase
MKHIQFSTDHSGIDDHKIADIKKNIDDEIINMNQASEKGYDDDRASINLPFDMKNMQINIDTIEEKKELSADYLLVVGIGGSNLGTIAVQEAVLGKLYNQLGPQMHILYADTVDSDLLYAIRTIIKKALQQDKKVIINGVSKSGSTTETIANLQTLISLLKKYQPSYQDYVVITTDKESKFWHHAQQHGYTALEIPKKVGGRYSVFSSVGLFPLGMIGVNINELLKGASMMRNQCLDQDLNQNIAAKSAAQIYLHRLQGKCINDLFLFSTDLESIGKWYRQLMAESIGKEYDIEGKQIFNGVTPTVSIGSTDLHSMAQLYLGGPYDKFTTFVKIKQNKHDISIPHQSDFESLVPVIQDKSLQEIMHAILHGTQTAFMKNNRPFVTITLPDKSEELIGQFLQFKMMEMMYLGSLMKVNPFDQPNVESYKIETKKILTNKQIINE